MAASIKVSRGDIKLKTLQNGELFWSYINTDPANSNGHSFSVGQLWIKDPSKEEPVLISSLRNLEALRIAGHIQSTFSSFTTAHDIIYNRCQPGDIFILDTDMKTQFVEPYYKGDLLIITKAVYEEDSTSPFGTTLTSVEYLRYPGTQFNAEGTDLEATTIQDAIEELSVRWNYKGEFTSALDFVEATHKKRGNAYLLRESFSNLNKTNFDAPEDRIEGDFVILRKGDFVIWTGSAWKVAPSGIIPADIRYVVSPTLLDDCPTFIDFHKDVLRDCTNLQELLDVLVKYKAPLDAMGKIPYSVLPETVRNGLSLRGSFQPVKPLVENANLPQNQNGWPTPTDDTNQVVSIWANGWFYIVDCFDHKNVQYKDPRDPSRIIELNTGDFIVWCDSTHRFEIIDNSDRISQILAEDTEGTTHSLLEDVKIKGRGLLKVHVADNTIELEVEAKPYAEIEEWKPNRFVRFDATGRLIYTSLLEEEGYITALKTIRVSYTSGNSPTSFVNHGFEILSKVQGPEGILERLTTVKASEEGDDEKVDLVLPNKSSTLLGQLEEDALIPGYITKVHSKGFLTDSLIKEEVYDTAEGKTSGLVNMGLGKMAINKMLTGGIAFFSPSEQAGPGFTATNVQRDLGLAKDPLYEHTVDEQAPNAVLQIHPQTVARQSNITVYLPEDGGVLTTFEEQKDIYSNTGEALIVPVWEEFTDHDRAVLGLSKSPISIRMNRTRSGHELTSRVSTLHDIQTYTQSNTDPLGPTDENVVSFDAWLESKRIIASKQGLALPSANQAGTEKITNTGTASAQHKMATILPSESVFEGDVAYTDVYGHHIPQNVQKVIELPAESGVLATHESILRGKYYTDD